MAYATLRVLEGPLQGRVLPITRRAVTIGSQPPADLPPDGAGYPELAPQHAAIAWSGAGFAVRDLTGGSGLKLDGEPIAAAQMPDGGVLECGGLKLQLAVPPEGPSFDDPAFVPVPPAAAAGRPGAWVAIAAGVALLAFAGVGAGMWLMQRPGARGAAPVPASAPAPRATPGPGGAPRVAPEPQAPVDGVEEAVRGATVVVEGPDAWGVGFHIGENRILTSRTAMCGPDGDELATMTVTMHPETDAAVELRVPREQIAVYRSQESYIEGAVLNAGVLRPSETVTALVLALGTSESVKEGDTVTVAGYAGPDRSGGLQITATKVIEVVKDDSGQVIVLGIEEELPDGYSGGPVVDGDGRVVGLYSGTMSQDGEAAHVCVSTAVLKRLLEDGAGAE